MPPKKKTPREKEEERIRQSLDYWNSIFQTDFQYDPKRNFVSNKRQAPQKPLDSILSTNEISKIYDRVVKKLDVWERKTFKGKGALGEIPGWFQEHKYHVIRLSVARERLARRWDEEKRKFVKKYSLKEIRKMMDVFRKHQETGDPAPFDVETYGFVSVVCSCDKAISAGPDEGLKLLIGEETAKAISEKKVRLKNSEKGNTKIQNDKQEREDEILKFLTTLNSNRARGRSASQLIKNAADHFAGEKGYKEASIRRVWNKHFKKI